MSIARTARLLSPAELAPEQSIEAHARRVVAGLTRRERSLMRRAGLDVTDRREPDAEFAATTADIAAGGARIDALMDKLDASIAGSREFWAQQEAAREADSWQAAWARAGL